MNLRKAGSFALLLGASLVAACNDEATGTCTTVAAGRVTSGAAGVAGVSLSIADTLRPGSVPLATVSTNAQGEWGVVVNGECPSCAVRVTPPVFYRLPDGAPDRKPAALNCEATTTVDFTLQRSTDAPD